MVKSQKRKTLKTQKSESKKPEIKLRISAVIKRLSSVSCPDCGKPAWPHVVRQIKKLEKFFDASLLKKDLKEEAKEFFVDVIEGAESYYLNKSVHHQYLVTKKEEESLEKFQNRKDIKNIADEKLVKTLEEFPVIADWLSIPDKYLPFGQKKALLLILRKIKK